MIVVRQMCQEEWFKFSFDTRNNGAIPLDPACPWIRHALSAYVFDHQQIYPITF